MGWTHTGNVTASIFTGSMHIRRLLMEGHRHTATGYATQQDEYARIIKYYNKSPIEVQSSCPPYGICFCEWFDVLLSISSLSAYCRIFVKIDIALLYGLGNCIISICINIILLCTWGSFIFVGELLCKINFLVFHFRALVVRKGNKINKIIGLEIIDRLLIFFVNQ